MLWRYVMRYGDDSGAKPLVNQIVIYVILSRKNG